MLACGHDDRHMQVTWMHSPLMLFQPMVLSIKRSTRFTSSAKLTSCIVIVTDCVAIAPHLVQVTWLRVRLGTMWTLVLLPPCTAEHYSAGTTRPPLISHESHAPWSVTPRLLTDWQAPVISDTNLARLSQIGAASRVSVSESVSCHPCRLMAWRISLHLATAATAA